MKNESSQWLKDVYRGAKAALGKLSDSDQIVFYAGEEDLRQRRFINFDGQKIHFLEKVIRGDFCHVYFGTINWESGLEHVCIKVPFEKRNNDLMANEASVLTGLRGEVLPYFFNSLTLEDGRVANVTGTIIDGYDMASVAEMYGDGVPEEPIEWILGRCLYNLGVLNDRNIVHGAIEPGNIVVVTDDQRHNAAILDYLFAITNADEKGKEYKGITEFSAPELIEAVYAGKPKPERPEPHPIHDMYSLAKSLLWCINGGTDGLLNALDKLHPRIAEIFSGMLELSPGKRLSDAWETWHKLRAVRKELDGGEVVFKPFILPVMKERR